MATVLLYTLFINKVILKVYNLYSFLQLNFLDAPKRATKQETELRVAHAAELVAEGQAYSSITSLVAAKYGISRRRARQITSNAYLLLKDDIEEGDLNRPEMTAKLVCTLETAMFRAM